MEKTLGITNKIKKAKSTNEVESSSRKIKNPRNKTKDPTGKNCQKIEQTPNTLLIINNKVKICIQHGKKWVGI